MPLKISYLESVGYLPPGSTELAQAELTGEINACPEPVGDLHYALNLSTLRCEPFLYSERFGTGPTLLEGVLQAGVIAAGSLLTGGLSLIPTLAAGTYGGITEEPLPTEVAIPLRVATIAGGGGVPVNGFGDLFTDISELFSGEATFGDVFADVGSVLPYFATPLLTSLAARPAAPMLPAIRPPTAVPPRPGFAIPGGMAGMIGRFANRFPNLAGALTAMKLAGQTLSRSKAWSLLRQYGPSVLTGFGTMWTLEAINELMIAGPGRRRMNPANVKALRRSARRLESFHKLCGRVDVLRKPRRSSSRRCPKCRTNPCAC